MTREGHRVTHRVGACRGGARLGYRKKSGGPGDGGQCGLSLGLLMEVMS